MKKFISVFMVFIISTAVTACGGSKDENAKIGVCFYKYDDTYISSVRQEFENLADKNVTVYLNDGKGDQGTQNDQIDLLIQKNVDVLVVNLVDVGAAQTVVSKAKSAGIPIIFFNREPSSAVLESYDKAVFVGTNPKEAGEIQGNIIADTWESDSKYDKNGDGKIQYVLLKGEPDNPEAVARTDYSLGTLKERGIPAEELGLQVCNWDTELANGAMTGWISKFGDKIEFVISNNDSMAQGAVSALQSAGYNKGDGDKFVPVVGVDATDAAKELINKGYMTGTVMQDAKAMAKALYQISINISEGRENLYATEYEYENDSKKAVRIPYSAYKGDSNAQ